MQTSFFKTVFIIVIVIVSALFFAQIDEKTDASPAKKAENHLLKDTSKSDIEKKSEIKNQDLKVQETRIEKEKFKVLKGKITNKTVYEELVSHNISAAEILKLSKSFKKQFDFRWAKKGDCYSLEIDEDGELNSFSYKCDVLNEYVAKKDENGFFKVSKDTIIPETKIKYSEFTIESSLYNAIVNKGEKRCLVNSFAEIFSWDIDFYLYPRKGDKIHILYEKKYIEGKFSSYGKILAALYIGSKDKFSAYLYDDGDMEGYYDESGKPLRKMFLKIPVKFGVKTSSFSIRRFHPVKKKYKAHTGIDYGARTGTKIFATASGKVMFSGWKRGYGKLVILKHPNGYKTYYGHCSKLESKKGDLVKQGEIIARVGQTGVATGPHVHYEIRINNKPVNPNTVKTIEGKSIAPKNLAAFKEFVSSRNKLMNIYHGVDFIASKAFGNKVN